MESQGSVLRESPVWNRAVIEDIQTKADVGRYRYAGGALHRPVPNFDGLTFLPCTLSRVPLEGYRERCETKVVLGTRAPKPLELDIPILVVGMSFGALSRTAKAALGKAASRVGTCTTTGDGGMHPMERENSKKLVYQICPSHYGNNPEHMRMADAVEIVVGQGAKPGTGGVLLGMKVSDEVARMRTLPLGVDQRSPVRHPDFIGADDLVIKIDEVKEATEGQIPIFVKIGACRVRDDVKLAAKAGADVIVIDGMEGASGASPEILFDHTGIPTLAAVVLARRALEEIGLSGEVQLVIQGGIRGGVDAAKAIALGADCVGVGTAALIALGCNKDLYPESYERLGTKAGFCHHCHTGGCPVGITTQDEELIARLPVDEAADHVTNFLRSMTMEIQMLARACGKADVRDMEPEDMRSLNLETAMITGIPLVGMDTLPWVQGPSPNGHH
jgi:glutamate synthase domain-containing protein 2